MTSPYAAPQWAPPEHPWPPPAPPVAERIRWGSEAAVAVLVAAYSTVLGAVAGLLWSRFSPKLYRPTANPRLVAAVNGSEAAAKTLLGDDMWLVLFVLLAAVAAVAVLVVSSRRSADGPGAMLGLAVGGVLGSLVAAQVGHQIQNPHIVHSLKLSFPGITAGDVSTILGYFGFRLRIKAVLLAWPIAAVALNTLVVGLRSARVNAVSLAARR